MAEEEVGQERTEAPSPRRREEARKQGLIAVSGDLNTGVLLLIAAAALASGARTIGGGLIDSARAPLTRPCTGDLTIAHAQVILADLFLHALRSVGFLFALLFVGGVALGLLQSGFAFYPDILSVKWERLDPTAGLKRVFSLGSGVRTVTSLLKVGLMTLLAVIFVRGRIGLIARAGEGSLVGSVALGWDLLSRLFLAIAVAMLIVGLFDYAMQRYRTERQMRLTRQEAKEELKQEEGDPQIRARIRRLQREAAQRRMMEKVPEATVVITNPTHYAVALRYERGAMAAPRVVALGAGYVAERIIEIARRHAVPIVPNPPLARALYRAGKLDREIPEALYQAVAEVLAFVYRLRGLA